jgi:hypothetical protein
MMVLEEKNIPTSERNEASNEVAGRLWTYASYLQRVRRQEQQREISSDVRPQSKAATSLAYFLETNVCRDADDEREPLSRAFTQAIHIAADAQNYRLILRLVDAVLYYAKADSDPQCVVDPRIVGEAIQGIARTQASVGKIKTLWKRMYAHPALAAPVGSRQVNAMLQALESRGKSRAVVDLYHEASSQSNATDAYSLSIALNALTASVTDDQAPVKPEPLPSLYRSRFAVWQSNCWQWNEALILLGHGLETNKVNNPAVSALLQLNDRASRAFTAHRGPQLALAVLDIMREHNIVPDTVTVTLVLSSLGREWEIALTLLESMKPCNSTSTPSSSWSLPEPNEFCYSATMAICARSRQYQLSLELLNDMRRNSALQINTVVYNSVLQALVGNNRRREGKVKKAQRKKAQDRVRAMFQILGHMEEDIQRQLDTRPNTNTYNTILLILATSGKLMGEREWVDIRETFPAYFHDDDDDLVVTSNPGSLARYFLNDMAAKSVERSALTYRNAILASSASHVELVLNMLKLAEAAIPAFASDRGSIYNAALTVMANAGYAKEVLALFSKMTNIGVIPNRETTGAIITALARGQQTKSIPSFLSHLAGMRKEGKVTLFAGVTLDLTSLPHNSQSDFSLALSLCLTRNDYKSAKDILEVMRTVGCIPTAESLERIAIAYARGAMTKPFGARNFPDGQAHRLKESRAKARNAYDLTVGMEGASLELLAIVSKACAHVGYFDESMFLLREIHRMILASQSLSNALPNCGLHSSNFSLEAVHRKILHSCANAGNVTAALDFVGNIQQTSRKLRRINGRSQELPLAKGIKMDRFTSKSYSCKGETMSKVQLGMQAEDWKSLIIAGSKSGHWRVCLSTLQFLQPYLDNIRPSKVSDEYGLNRMEKEYESISKALTWAVKCMSVRSQYGWAIRAIQDWLEWTDRRPPKEAVSAAVRVLSTRGRGDEIISLLEKCLSIPSTGLSATNSYEVGIYVEAITTLYRDGLYESADDAFIRAVANGILPLQLENCDTRGNRRIVLDLHGMNVAVAHSAVRIALHQEILTASWNHSTVASNEFVIVTGRGQKSAFKMRPVLRPEVQRMLVEEFYPPLSTLSVPGNLGALTIPLEDICSWLNHQRVQKGARMMSIAAVLRNLSSGKRLHAALSKANELDPGGP